MSGRVEVFIACSLDGFIAGVDDDISWLGTPGQDGGSDFGYGAFFASVGAILMGRRTYDVAEAFDAWPYEDRPVLVATHRELTPKVPTVRAVSGAIAELVETAREVAGDKVVYLDGGKLIRQALDAELVDALTVSIIPIVLGAGIPLFAGTTRRHELELTADSHVDSGLVQLRYRPRKPRR